MRLRLILFAILLCGGAALAGCASKAPPAPDTSTAPTLSGVTATTGGIRGLVVDQAVRPLAGAHVTLAGGANKTTGADGLFNFTNLQPGDYFVQVVKPGYKSVQASATVKAGVVDPPVVKVLLEALSSAQPYLDFFKLDGFYECASSVAVDTDTCDWVYRTGWDVANDTGHQPPTPRSFMEYHNTQYIDVPADTYTLIQEGFWTDESVKKFWVMIDSTPIDSSCDCSLGGTYGNVIGENPIYNRMDRFKADGTNNTDFRSDFTNPKQVGTFPAGATVVSRGFLPFMDSPPGSTDPNSWYEVAQNFRFTVITSLFHNYVAPDGWTFETQDKYKIG